MTTNPQSTTAKRSKALRRASTFGPAPILEIEDAAAYDELLVEVSSAMKPTDIIEECWVHDVVSYIWEALRLRRAKARVLSDETPRQLNYILNSLFRKRSATSVKKNSDETNFPSLLINYEPPPPPPPSPADKLVIKWTAGDPVAIKRVEKLVASKKLSMAVVFARAFMARFDDIERIDRLTRIAEGCRNSVLREVDRRRAFARALRIPRQEIEDAEFETIGPKTIASNATNKNST